MGGERIAEGVMCIGSLDMTNIAIEKNDSERVFHLAPLGIS